MKQPISLVTYSFHCLLARQRRRVLSWLKERAAANDQPYQSLINEILDKAMRRAR